MPQLDLRFNKAIEQFIATGTFLIDEDWAIEQYAQYLNEIMLVTSGVPYSELGIKERKAAAQTTFAFLQNGSILQYSEDELDNQGVGKEPRVAVMRLNGVMRSQDSLSTQGMQSKADEVYSLNARPEIAGLVLEVSSGGGEALAATILQTALKHFSKPLYVVNHFSGSAAVKASLPAKGIYMSSESSRMGSIGSMMQISNEALRTLREEYTTIYSNASVDKNAALRQLLKGKTDLLVKELDESAVQFQNEVKLYRNLAPDLMESTLAGGVFYTQDAIKRGLADGVMNPYEAVDNILSQLKSDTMSSTNTGAPTFFQRLTTQLQRAFNITVPENATEEQVLQMLEAQPAIDAQISNAVEAQTTQLRSALTAAQTDIASLQQQLADVQNVSATTEALSALEAQFADMQKAIADLQAGPNPAGEGNSFGENSTVGQFANRLSAFSAAAGESEY